MVVQIDYKPLIPIFFKNLDRVSARLQCMLLRLLKYTIQIEYLSGRDMLIADILSLSYIKTPFSDYPEMNYMVHALYNNIPMSEERKSKLHLKTMKFCLRLKSTVKQSGRVRVKCIIN